jgi:hypothetical protein
MAKRKKDQTPQAVKANKEGPQSWREFQRRLYGHRSTGGVSDKDNETLFRAALAGFGCDPVWEIEELLPKLECYLGEGQTQQALLEVARSIADLSAKLSVLATILERYRPALGKEFRRAAGKQAETARRHERKEAQIQLAKELFADWPEADFRKPGGPIRAHTEIGEIIAQRLGLPKPIKPDTIRKYLR